MSERQASNAVKIIVWWKTSGVVNGCLVTHKYELFGILPDGSYYGEYGWRHKDNQAPEPHATKKPSGYITFITGSIPQDLHHQLILFVNETQHRNESGIVVPPGVYTFGAIGRWHRSRGEWYDSIGYPNSIDNDRFEAFKELTSKLEPEIRNDNQTQIDEILTHI